MRKIRRRPLHLSSQTIRQLTRVQIAEVAAGLVATSEAADGYPCPGEYSYFCKP
jgi:hypothetical protein